MSPRVTGGFEELNDEFHENFQGRDLLGRIRHWMGHSHSPKDRGTRSKNIGKIREVWSIPEDTSDMSSSCCEATCIQSISVHMFHIALPRSMSLSQVVGHSYIVYGPLIQGCATVPLTWYSETGRRVLEFF